MRPPARLRVIACDAAGMPATAATIDHLARVELAAQRAGLRVHLANVSPELEELLEFAGLGDALRVEAQGQPEEGEERGGVEEEGDVGDAPL
jgi:hypothetical protein